MKELWYVSCSPRNPAKIRNEVSLLAKLEGEEWKKKMLLAKTLHS